MIILAKLKRSKRGDKYKKTKIKAGDSIFWDTIGKTITFGRPPKAKCSNQLFFIDSLKLTAKYADDKRFVLFISSASDFEKLAEIIAITHGLTAKRQQTQRSEKFISFVFKK